MKLAWFAVLAFSLTTIDSFAYGADRRIHGSLAGQCDAGNTARFRKQFPGLDPSDCNEVCLHNSDFGKNSKKERCWIAPSKEAGRTKDLVNAVGAAMGSENNAQAVVEIARNSDSTRALSENLRQLSANICAGTDDVLATARRDLKLAEANQHLVYKSMSCPVAKEGQATTNN